MSGVEAGNADSLWKLEKAANRFPSTPKPPEKNAALPAL